MSTPALEFPSTFPIPEEVVQIARRLEDAGFETWCVGGAVRDNLLKLDNKDFDLATAAPPAKIQELFPRTIPIGVEHGTVAVLDQHRRPHEVTTFRRDVRTDGRHAVVEFGVSLDDDLARRDFTINAIAHHPIRHEWRDPFDGRSDLVRRRIRAVGDPERRFREDYLRILRAIRFATRFGFDIDAQTWAAARAQADGLRHLSGERVRAEWFRAIELAEQASVVAERWKETGAVAIWLVEIGEPGTGNPESTFQALDRFALRDPVLMTAYLSNNPVATLTRLRCSNAEIERGRLIHEHRGRRPDPSVERDVRRWMANVGSAVDDLVTLAIVAEANLGKTLEAAVKRVRSSGAPLSLGALAVTGRDLQRIGVPSGPGMGALLRRLLEIVLDDPTRNTPAELLELAKQLAAEPSS